MEIRETYIHCNEIISLLENYVTVTRKLWDCGKVRGKREETRSGARART